MNLTNKKVLFIESEDFRAVNHRLALIKHLQEQNNKIYVACNVSTYLRDIIKNNIIPLNLNIDTATINPFTQTVLIVKLYKLFQWLKPEIIHVFGIKNLLSSSMALFFSGYRYPMVISVTGLGHAFLSSGIKGFFLRSIITMVMKFFVKKRSIKIIVQNEDDHSFFIEKGLICKDQIFLVKGSGVDLEAFKSSMPSNSPIVKIVAISRMLREKGIYELVEACEILNAQRLSFKLDLVGSNAYGNPSSIPIDTLKQWNNKDYIDWHGDKPYTEIPRWLDKADIVCLPSYREGLPKTLLEAAASGKPLVATNVPGCREIVKSGYNGYLAKIKDASSLAHFLSVLIGNKDLRLKMGQNSRNLVEQEFSNEKITNCIMTIYTTM